MGMCYNKRNLCGKRIEIVLEKPEDRVVDQSITNVSTEGYQTAQNHKRVNKRNKTLPQKAPEKSLNDSKLELFIRNEADKADSFAGLYPKPMKTHQAPLDIRKDLIKDKTSIHIIIYGAPDTGKSTFGFHINKKKTNNFYIPSVCTEIMKSQILCKHIYYKLVLSIPAGKDKDVIFNADCYFVFFDYTSEHKFQEACNFIEKRLLKYPEPIYLIGNKCDQKRQISFEKVSHFCKKKGLKYFDISSHTGFGILKLMKTVGNDLKPRTH